MRKVTIQIEPFWASTTGDVDLKAYDWITSLQHFSYEKVFAQFGHCSYGTSLAHASHRPSKNPLVLK